MWRSPVVAVLAVVVLLQLPLRAAVGTVVIWAAWRIAAVTFWSEAMGKAKRCFAFVTAATAFAAVVMLQTAAGRGPAQWIWGAIVVTQLIAIHWSATIQPWMVDPLQRRHA